MTKTEIRHAQNSMNNFSENHRSLGYTSLRADGEFGQLTKKRIRQIKYDLGYMREHINTTVNDNFFKRMNHPNWVKAEWGQTKEAVRRGKKRRARRRLAVARNKVRAYLKPGVGYYDGKPVAKCAIPILNWCRMNGWHGVLVSGWRDPKYSQSLCFRMCGRPSCPGQCAGTASNHVGNSPSKFALDVSDYTNFERIVARCPIKPRIRNLLGARDPVHFSPSGN